MAIFDTTRQFVGKLWYVVKLLLGIPICAPLRVFRVWFMPIDYEGRIGHLILETLAATIMQREDPKKYRAIISCATPRTSANPEVLSRLRGAPKAVRRWVPSRVGRLLAWHPISRLPTRDWITAIGQSAKIFGHTDALTRTKLLPSQPDDAENLKRLLMKLNIPEGMRYVALHVREPGYAKYDDNFHDYRNGNTHKFNDAIDWLIERNYVVVRVGNAPGSHLPEREGLIDYSLSGFRSPLNDILLLGNCTFMIGNTSGLHVLATVQGRPVVGVDMAPMSAFGIVGHNCLSIPKLYQDLRSGGLLDFRTSLSAGLGGIRSTEGFARAGIALRECSGDEVRDVIEEMHFRVGGEWQSVADDDLLQRRFRSLLTNSSYSQLSETRIGSAFLRKYRRLLQ